MGYSPERAAILDAFIAGTEWKGAVRTLFPGDASTRSYEWLDLNGKRAVLMNAPLVETMICTPGMTEAERIAAGDNATRRLAASRVDAFVCIADYLKSRGLSVPEIYAFDVAGGCAIMSDLGDGQYWALLQRGYQEEAAMYEAATDVLVELHHHTPPAVLNYKNASWPLFDYDSLALDTEVGLFIEWYAGRHNGLTLTDDVRVAWRAAWHSMYRHLKTDNPALIIRDYHSPNLIWLPKKADYQCAGVVDFQDAILGHAAFDLMFLLNDARRDVPEAIESSMLQRYLKAANVADTEAFMNAYHVYMAVNNARICGVFCRLNYRDGKAHYMQHLPRVQNYVRKALQHPACKPLADWFHTYLPQGLKEAA